MSWTRIGRRSQIFSRRSRVSQRTRTYGYTHTRLTRAYLHAGSTCLPGHAAVFGLCACTVLASKRVSALAPCLSLSHTCMPPFSRPDSFAFPFMSTILSSFCGDAPYLDRSAVQFPLRELASFVASKCYFHLEEYDGKVAAAFARPPALRTGPSRPSCRSCRSFSTVFGRTCAL